MNFARDVVEAAGRRRSRSSSSRATARGANGASARSRRVGGDGARRFDALGVRRGDVVMTLVGNRPEWVFTMVACLRQGYVVLPCTEQLRAKDLALRLEVTRPARVVCDERNARRARGGRLDRG